jgi:hypothetical protein
MVFQTGAPSQQIARLYAALGDHQAGDRADGIFEALLGGPGSVPELAALPAEWQIDLLPFPPTPAQVGVLLELGYVQTETREDRLTYSHADGLNVVLLSHDHGSSFDQKLLWAHLKESAEACQNYRMVYMYEGREAADARSVPRSQTEHVARTGFKPLEQVAALLGLLRVPWMYAAGWALDLHRSSILGLGPSRPHEDVDVIVGREQQLVVGQALTDAGYCVHGVRSGAYVPWAESLDTPHFQLHAHREGSEMVDLMLTDLSGDRWHFRRDPAVTLPLARARQFTPLGLPYLAVEAALLFKATGANGVVRPKDQRDFEVARPAMDAQARHWLATHLAADHPWQVGLGD